MDEFACGLSDPKWRDGVLKDADIAGWAKSCDLWWWRAAVVSTLPLNLKSRGGAGDSKRTLMICALVGADLQIMVQRALSWALRELSRRDRQGVDSFLRKLDAALGALVKREVRRKMVTGKKNGGAGVMHLPRGRQARRGLRVVSLDPNSRRVYFGKSTTH